MSQWAEDKLIESLAHKLDLFTVRFGLSESGEKGPETAAVPGTPKRPDLLVYRRSNLAPEEIEVLSDPKLPHLSDADVAKYDYFYSKALAAIEVKTTAYRAAEMSERNWQCRTEAHIARYRCRNANPPIAPNVWLKEGELPALVAWQSATLVPVTVVHLFDQEGFALSLDSFKQFSDDYDKSSNRVLLQLTRGIFKGPENYNRVDASGAGEIKTVFRATPAICVKVADIAGVKPVGVVSLSASKKYVSQVVFTEGTLSLTDEFITHVLGLRAFTAAANRISL